VSTLCAKTSLAVSAHHFGAASTDRTHPQLLSQGNEKFNREIGKQEHVYIEQGT